MKKYMLVLKYVLVGIGLLLLLFQFEKIQELRELVKIKTLENNELLEQDQALIAVTKNNIKGTYIGLEKSVLLFHDLPMKQSKLEKDTILYLRINKADCNDCVRQAFSVLNKNSIINVSILTNYPSVQEFLSDFKEFSGNKVFIVDSLALDIWGVTTPYAFYYSHLEQKFLGLCYLNYLHIDLFDFFLKNKNPRQIGNS